MTYRTIHGVHGYGERNEMGESILDFASAYDLTIANPDFLKGKSTL